MKKYEYTYVSRIRSLSDNDMNILGDLGWELVTVVYHHNYYEYFFRREKTDK